MTVVVATLTLATATHASPPKIGTAARYDSRCGDAWQAVRWYRARYNHHRAVMGASLAPPVDQAMGCSRLRERAVYWRDAAKANRAAAMEWTRREYANPPEPFLSIARCETGGINGGQPLWTHYNSVYEGGFGFTHQTWDQFKPAGYPASAAQATPRQQTTVARILVARFGGYSSWPACHRRLGLPG